MASVRTAPLVQRMLNPIGSTAPPLLTKMMTVFCAIYSRGGCDLGDRYHRHPPPGGRCRLRSDEPSAGASGANLTLGTGDPSPAFLARGCYVPLDGRIGRRNCDCTVATVKLDGVSAIAERAASKPRCTPVARCFVHSARWGWRAPYYYSTTGAQMITCPKKTPSNIHWDGEEARSGSDAWTRTSTISLICS
jgi:hypothetical protein